MTSSAWLSLSVICAFALAVISVTADLTSPVPFVAWSGSRFLESNGRSHSSLHEPLQRAAAIAIVADASATAEVVVAISFAKMSAAGLSVATGAYATTANAPAPLASLKALISGSQSSVTGSMLAGEGSVMVLVLSAASDAAVIEGAASKCDDLLTSLSSSPSVFTNGKRDIVFVTADDIAATGACLPRLMQLVQERSAGKFVAVLSADSEVSKLQTSFGHDSTDPVLLQSSMRLMASGNDTSSLPGVVYMTPAILFALFFGFFFLLAVCVGLCCLDSIQTPLRFPSRKLAVNKEY